MEIVLNKENFEIEVLRSKVPVLVDFWAEWCMPCHAIAPAIKEIAETYQGRLKVGKLNVDDHPELASTYQIHSIPNLKVFQNGQVVDEIIGVTPRAEIIKRLEKHLG